MNASYGVRLVCMALTCLLVVNLAVGVLVRLSLPWALRYADRLSARRASNLLLALRLLPAAAAWLSVAVFCVPSYLELESNRDFERLTFFCVTAAVLGAFVQARGAWRAVAAIKKTQRMAAHSARCASLDDAYVLDTRQPLIALAGVLRPRLVVSLPVLETLTEEELESAVRHEQAHRKAGDNLKRLLLLLAPAGLPFSKGLAVLERQLSRSLEWAADDDATAGDPARCLALASALVRVAQLGNTSVPVIVSPLVSADCSLAARVQRLLHGRPAAEQVSGRGWAAVAGVAILGAFAFYPASLPMVHALMERLLG